MAGVMDQSPAWDGWEDDRQGGSSGTSGTEGSGRVGHFEQLLRTIEGEIIPRLMLAHRHAAPSAAAAIGDGRTLDGEDVAEFTGLVLRHDSLVAHSYLQALRAQGVSLEVLFMELLAPAARRMGDMWDTDLLSFAEVTLGLGRMQQLLRDLTPGFHGESEYRSTGYRALLAPTPGEQHTFGLFLVSEFMRRAGWDVSEERTAVSRHLVSRVRQQHFHVVGLSLSCETRTDQLTACIRAMRKASRNPGLGVIVGGPLFLRQPEMVSRVGADATANDAREAPSQAEKLVGLLAGRS